jgi:hypothetical protein
VAVALVLVWWAPFWLLGPLIADSLSGLSNPPSAAAVTTAIVVVQTIIGLIGFWLGGTEVTSIARRSTKKQALRAIWSVLLHGEIPAHLQAPAPSGDEPPPSGDVGAGQPPPDSG